MFFQIRKDMHRRLNELDEVKSDLAFIAGMESSEARHTQRHGQQSMTFYVVVGDWEPDVATLSLEVTVAGFTEQCIVSEFQNSIGPYTCQIGDIISLKVQPFGGGSGIKKLTVAASVELPPPEKGSFGILVVK